MGPKSFPNQCQKGIKREQRILEGLKAPRGAKIKSRTALLGSKIPQIGTIDGHISAVKVSNALEKQVRMKLDGF